MIFPSRAGKPPVHLFLGSDALAQLRAKAREMEQGVNEWAELSRGADLEGRLLLRTRLRLRTEMR